MINRRSLLQMSAAMGAGTGLLGAETLFPSPARAAAYSAAQVDEALAKMRGRSLVVATWGGSFQEAQRAAYFKPFSEKYGIKVIEDGPPFNAKVIAMVQSGKVTWDVCSFGAFRIPALGVAGALEELDYSIIDGSRIVPSLLFKWGIGSDTTTTLLAYRADMVGAQAPTSVADLWDVKKFPGKRGLNDEPVHCIPFALYALGMPKDQIYPLTAEKIKRAYAKLDEIKNNAVWWTIGAQPTQLLVNKEVALSIAYNNRFDDVFKQGVPIKFAWEGGQFYGDGWGITKGSPNKDLAMLFLAWATLPQNNQAISTYIDLGPSNLDALSYVAQDRVPRMPNRYLDSAIVMDTNWWGPHWDEMLQQWKEWRLKA